MIRALVLISGLAWAIIPAGALNAWIKDYAAKIGAVYADYFSAAIQKALP